MTTQRASLTAQQAVTLAGAYADLVFGTSTPEFTADVAAAFLREQIRQQSNPHKESEALLVACFGENVVKALRAVGGFAARVREVPAPKASAGEEMCANMSTSAFLCDAARGHKDCHATHLAGGLIHFWPQHTPTASTVADFDAATVEAVTRCPICFGLNGSHNTIHARYLAGGGGTNKPCPNSSPDVPAPTETGPWPTLTAVPTSVRAVKDRFNHRWERRTDTTWKGCDEGPQAACDAGHPDSGPYTPAEDGGA